MAEAAGVSGATQAVLGLAGLSLLGILLYVAVLVTRTVSGLSRQRAAAATKGGKKVAAKQLAPGRAAAGTAAAAPAPAAPATAARPAKADLKALIKASKSAARASATKEDMAAHHALFLASLRGHTDNVAALSWAPDGRMMATACEDMTLRVFDMAGLGSGKELKFRWLSTPQPPVGIGWGNDGASLVAALHGYPELSLVCYSPHKAGNGVAWDTAWAVPAVLPGESLLDMAVVPAPQAAALGAQHAGGVAVLLSSKRDGGVWGLAGGRQLGAFQPNSLANHGLAVSADGRFIAVASFTADVMVWEVQWGRDGCKGVSKVMDLKGHDSQVLSAAFSPDGLRAATASKDGSLRLWNLAVRYALREDPKVLLKLALPLPRGQVFERMAWGPDGTIAASLGGHIHFISSSSGKVLEVLHAHDGPINGMAWCPRLVELHKGEGRTALLASCSTDRRVRVWKSPAGPRED